MIISCGIIPVFYKKDGSLFLFLKYKKYWDFPKGMKSSSESEISCAQRELKEETGIENIIFTWGRDFVETKPYLTKFDNEKVEKIARYYIAEVPNLDVELIPNPDSNIIEHDDYIWLSYKDAKKYLPLVPRILKVLEWASTKIT